MTIPFITYRENNDGVLRYYILQKDFPHNVGIIQSQPNGSAICQSVVPGYNLWVVFNGTLQGNFVQAKIDYAKELQVVYDNMAAFFWAERICLDKKRFEKFKVKSDVSTN